MSTDPIDTESLQKAISQCRAIYWNVGARYCPTPQEIIQMRLRGPSFQGNGNRAARRLKEMGCLIVRGFRTRTS